MAYDQQNGGAREGEERTAAIDAETGEATGELEYSARSRSAAKSAPVFDNAERQDEGESPGDDYYDEAEPDGQDAYGAEDAPEGEDAPGGDEADAYEDDAEAPYREPAPAPGRAKGRGSRKGGSAGRKRGQRRNEQRGAKRSKRGAIAALVITITTLALAAVLALDFTGRDGLLAGPLGAVLAPMQRAVTSVTSAVGKKLDAFNYNEQMERELNSALQELATINTKVARYDEVVAENERLRSLMGSYEKYSQYQPMFARVIGKDTGNWFSNFTVDKGSSNGVTLGMTVMSADGVVGRVVDVGINYAKVMSLIDGSSGVAALIERNRDNGVVRGMVDDTTGEDLLQMNYLPDVNDVRTGDTVLTSGLDGVFPKGLPIGTITQISRQSSGLSQYVVVTPFADFEHIEEVILLKPQS